jgi:transcriptional regulator with XRE-family HTH domain
MRKLKRLREVRIARKMSQQELARALRTNQSNVSQWETEKTKPWPHTVDKIAKALGCEPKELL